MKRTNIPIDPAPPEDDPVKVFVRVPDHLVSIIQAIAKRQRTSPAVVVAQALSDYCHRGL